MCAISGIISFTQKESRQSVQKMMDTLRHRGPDGEGLWQEGPACLGHRRLMIMDLTERGAQPLISKSGRYVLIYNGEVYNFKELGPYKNDCEAVLDAFEKWGASCLEKFNGMFSFAIWDTKEQSLFAARDRLGIKPFYYSLQNQSFTFASEIKALLAAGIPRLANYKKAGEFLKWGALDADHETWFENIFSLEAGHFLTFNRDGFKKQSYWNLADHVSEESQQNDAELFKNFDHLLKESIRLQLQGERSIGLHLSGGVDSTILTTLASKSSDHLSAYTFGYEERNYDERPYARQIIDTLRLSSYGESILLPVEIPQWLERVVHEEDEPFTSLRQLSHHKLYSDFAKSGSTVILEGSGGDEIGAGYSSYLWPNYLDQLAGNSVDEASHFLSQHIKNLGFDDSRAQRFLLGSAANYEQPGLCTADGIPYIIDGILDADFLNAANKWRPQYSRPFKSHLRNLQYIDLMHAKLPRGLRYIERASMASGREARLPLLDHRLVELAMHMPNHMKIHSTHLRKFMKEIAAPHLPGELLTPNKRSIADPQKAWLKEPLREMVLDVFNSQSMRGRGLFNVPHLLKAYENFCSADGFAHSLGVFQPFIVEVWFRVMIDGDSP